MANPFDQFDGAAGNPFDQFDTADPLDKIAKFGGNLAAGAVRGAGSIGATLLWPIDAARDVISGNTGSSHQDRLHDLDQGLQAMGADPTSLTYRGAKLAAEIAGTAGAGGLVAKGIRAAPLLADAIPNLTRAIETGGLVGGNLATRAAGGAIAGAAQNALVDPKSAGGGALIGGAVPVVGTLGGLLGSGVAKIGGGAKAVDPAKVKLAQEAVAAGYAIPPSDIQPQGLLTRIGEGLSGEVKTAQAASMQSQKATNNLLRADLGIGGEGPLTAKVLSDAKKPLFDVYDQAKNLSPDAAEAVGFWRQANYDAKLQGRYFAKSGNPEAQKAADAARSEAAQWASVIEDEAKKAGQPDLAQKLADARIGLAKIGTVEGVTAKAGWNVNAQKLAGLLDKGVPLSGNMRKVAEIAQQFPDATMFLKKTPKMFSKLDMAMGLLGVGGAMHTGGLSLGLMAASPLSRMAILSKAAQMRAASNLSAAGANPSAMGLLGYRLAPELALLGGDQ